MIAQNQSEWDQDTRDDTLYINHQLERWPAIDLRALGMLSVVGETRGAYIFVHRAAQLDLIVESGPAFTRRRLDSYSNEELDQLFAEHTEEDRVLAEEDLDDYARQLNKFDAA